ncbi:CpsD/CapB family tyrosine-protein kinase [Clostridium sp. D43t1_170807_H7]|uniref:CpsD/CapB family tyrosine-protein kinase n=1 Tax=Clostridium sp. D43t1_170807_H7 TaxID=2787140 RepID=UPI00189BC191|nr:CpsD/CapB family tyrosine-protein kinase [Clostridium sp. D43t1_170807_H7]
MLITKEKPKSLSAEAYRSLRTSIKFSSVDKPIKTIVVTSALIGEGKSTVAANLAYTLNQDGAKVLVIDCDLRKPSMHCNFSVSNEEGLTDVLAGNSDLKSVIKKVEESLFLITAGSISPNPAEILGLKAMKDLINELSTNFDYIILDTSSVLPASDALLLASKADATLIVVKARKTKEKMVKESYAQLVDAGANVIGTVLNESDKSLDNKYCGYYEEGKSKKGKRFNKI